MEEDNLEQRISDIDGEFEIDEEADNEDLESAMQEALEAVEKATGNVKIQGREEAPAAVGLGGNGVSEDQEIAKLQEEILELRDRSARTLADFENFRKRVERERLAERRFAAFDVISEFLAVVDNLERALASVDQGDELKTGVELIHRQMLDVMKNSGVSRIEAIGEEFDPRFHEAVAHHEDPTVSVPTVSEELQAGYQMFDRLLRPSVVKVAMPPEDPINTNKTAGPNS
jgi:molecular chaperone GrpE